MAYSTVTDYFEHNFNGEDRREEVVKNTQNFIFATLIAGIISELVSFFLIK